ncbi:MAG: hypothetical protein BMS9Abin04_188 [Planctomycetia bacterium]|nr:MAG: hypothetical protein BMS9Abin04_188 [Planctomycetia bacterium]
MPEKQAFESLHEIDLLQDEVLAKLDDLNNRIERTIAEFAPQSDGRVGERAAAALVRT